MTIRWLGVIPSIWPDYTDKCLRSMHPRFARNVMVVDNTHLNHGVAGSWNQAARLVLSQRLEYLVCISAAVRFGAPGGMDLLEGILGNPGAWAVEADKGLGWHLIAFARSTLERVGIFDENCWPAYSEDLDMGWRIHIAAEESGKPVTWPKVPIDAHLESVAHGIHVAHTHVEFVEIEHYLARKWGGHKDAWHERGYRRPFNDPSLPLSWWPQPPDPRAYAPYDRPAELAWGAP